MTIHQLAPPPPSPPPPSLPPRSPPSPLQPGAVIEIVPAKEITLVLKAGGSVEEYEAKADSVKASLRQELQCFLSACVLTVTVKAGSVILTVVATDTSGGGSLDAISSVLGVTIEEPLAAPWSLTSKSRSCGSPRNPNRRHCPNRRHHRRRYNPRRRNHRRKHLRHLRPLPHWRMKQTHRSSARWHYGHCYP